MLLLQLYLILQFQTDCHHYELLCELNIWLNIQCFISTSKSQTIITVTVYMYIQPQIHAYRYRLLYMSEYVG